MQTVTKLPKHRKRSDPPARISRDAKRIWRRTWKEAPAGHFDPTLIALFADRHKDFGKIWDRLKD